MMSFYAKLHTEIYKKTQIMEQTSEKKAFPEVLKTCYFTTE